ncbi:MAG: chromate transporter [Chloroflexota bacterium]|nr:chromate transporter [Dehalococcoidia bacterium]MDW8253258.1 chromate transporter [Chloroflexota bacterium]
MNAPPSLAAFLGRVAFIAATAFGGGMSVHYYHHFVERTGWLRRDEFFQDMTLAQLLPGPNMVNVVAIIGQRLYGPRGAALATIAVLLPGTVLLVALGSFIAAVSSGPATLRVLDAVAAAAAGLLAATIVRLAPSAKGVRGNVGIVFVLVLLLAVVRLPMALVLLVVVPVAIVLNRPRAP